MHAKVHVWLSTGRIIVAPAHSGALIHALLPIIQRYSRASALKLIVMLLMIKLALSHVLVDLTMPSLFVLDRIKCAYSSKKYCKIKITRQIHHCLFLVIKCGDCSRSLLNTKCVLTIIYCSILIKELLSLLSITQIKYFKIAGFFFFLLYKR